MLSIYLHRGDLYSDLWKSDLYFGLADWGEIRLTFCWRLKPATKLSIWGIPWDARRVQQGKGGARARNGSPTANETWLSDYNGYGPTKIMSRSLSNHDGKGNGSENVTYQKWISGISNLIRYSIIPFRYSIIPFRSNLSNVRKRNRGLIRPSVPLRIEFLFLIPKGFSPRQVHQFFLLFRGNTSKLILDLHARRQVERHFIG